MEGSYAWAQDSSVIGCHEPLIMVNSILEIQRNRGREWTEIDELQTINSRQKHSFPRESQLELVEHLADMHGLFAGTAVTTGATQQAYLLP